MVALPLPLPPLDGVDMEETIVQTSGEGEEESEGSPPDASPRLLFSVSCVKVARPRQEERDLMDWRRCMQRPVIA